MSYFASNLPRTQHCFFNRHGGVSQGKYASLNASLRSEDENKNIYKNLEIAAHYFHKTVKEMNVLIQGVSNKAVYITQAQLFQTCADGAVTDKPDIILAIRTADCAPILFYDEKHQIIGAAHAGWRGALRGIIENTLDLMLSLGATKQEIKAAIGPCLQKQSFACQADMMQEFLNQDKEYQTFFTQTDASHWQFDAQSFCVKRLEKYGINDISASDINTYTDENYFSYRRNCHQKLLTAPLDFPSHLSTITL